MIVLPAIDLKGGRCVRLRQGRAAAETAYDDDPVAAACRWRDQGARWLHVVDLDGAFMGRPVHTAVIERLAARAAIPLQAGGGLRSDADVAALLDAGAARAVIGTRALADPAALGRLIARWGERIVVGIDARGGLVQIKGWVETSGAAAVDFARRVEDLGVRTVIYTDTATDGMLTGPNLAAVDGLCRAVRCRVIASGGIRSAADIRALARLGHTHLEGAIVGRALYEGIAALPDLLAAAAEGTPCSTTSA